MNTHGARHEEFLQAVVAGDVALDADEVSALRRECGQCARLLDGLIRAQALLAADRAEQEEILALAAGMTSAPGEDRIEALRHHPELRAGAAPARRGWRAAALLALAAAALALFLLPFERVRYPWGVTSDDPAPRMLGTRTEDLTLLAPLGDLPDYEAFTWSVSPELESEVGYYALVVRGEGQAEQVVARVRDTQWSAPPTQAFPDQIEWWVEAYGAGGEELAVSAPAAARRSR